jgi:hypothetical protein
MQLDLARIETLLRDYVGAFAPIVLQDAIQLSGIDLNAPRVKDLPAFLYGLATAMPEDINRQEVLIKVRQVIGM